MDGYATVRRMTIPLHSLDIRPRFGAARSRVRIAAAPWLASVDAHAPGGHEGTCDEMPLTTALLTAGRTAVSFSTPGHRQGRSCASHL